MAKADYVLKIRDGRQWEMREADEDQEADLVGIQLRDASFYEYGIEGYVEREVVPPIRKFGGEWYDAITETIGFRFLFMDHGEVNRLVDNLGKTINVKIENENKSP